MTLLIADDEELIRFSIKDMIRECGIDFSRIWEAPNGNRMISECRKHHPDLALVDIRMPGKSGLEAIEELSDMDTLWIILTGHADFEYARKALQLSAEDYILKPPSPEELAKVLHRATERLREKHLARQIEFEKVVTWVFSNTSSPEYHPIFEKAGSWSGWVICLDSILPQKETLKEQTRLSITLREQFLGTLEKGCYGALTTTDSGKLEITIFREKGSDPADCSIPGPLMETGSDREGVKITFIPVKERLSFEDYRNELEKTEEKASFRFIMGSSRISGSENPSLLAYSKKLENLSTLAGSSRKEDMDEQLRELIEIDLPLSKDQETCARDFFLSVLGKKHKADSLSEILQDLTEGMEEETQDGPSLLVQQALRIIREDYSQDIGIAQIAYKLQVTPNYLSSLFRKHTGTPFTRYITEIRMNRARKLLKETNLNIKEITQEVGYHSSRHFAGLFRQETGLTPTEYIRKYRK